MLTDDNKEKTESKNQDNEGVDVQGDMDRQSVLESRLSRLECTFTQPPCTHSRFKQINKRFLSTGELMILEQCKKCNRYRKALINTTTNNQRVKPTVSYEWLDIINEI